MIPVFWRYAISNYLKIFSLSLASIVLMLIVARFKEIATFAINADWPKTALFTLYQIPFIFPIAIPISALIASFLFFQNMSRSQEISALRAAGFSLSQILAPFLFLAALLSLLNFSFSAKIAPFCFRESIHILYPKTSQNPLLLLHQRKMLKHKNTYLQTQEKEGGLSKLILIARNGSTRRLELLLADRLRCENEHLLGENIAIVSHFGKESDATEFDPLFIENQTSMSMKTSFLSELFAQRPPKISIRALDFSMLPLAAQQKGKLGRYAWIELLRRCSLSFAVFSFTLLGSIFALETGKKGSKMALFFTLFFTLLLLSSYFLGKGLRFSPKVALLSFLFPHCLIWLASFGRIFRITRGTDS